MSSRIRVIVCIPDVSLRREICLSPSMRVYDIKKILPDPDCELLYDGLAMTESQPLNFYQVSDGAIIVAISRKEPHLFCPNYRNNSIDEKNHGNRSESDIEGEAFHQNMSFWSHICESNDNLAERMKMRLDPRTSGEFARLRDIRMMKICERPILLERFEQCYSIFAQNSRNRKIEPTVVLPNNEESPCEMPLPTLW